MMQGKTKIYLVVADETRELDTALRFACFLARERGSKVGVLYAQSDEEFSHWGKVQAMMESENRQRAEKFVLGITEKIWNYSATMPVIFMESGKTAEAIIKVIDEHPEIVRLILGGSTRAGNPGPLVTYFSSKGFDRLKVPLTVVPDTLTEDRFGD